MKAQKVIFYYKKKRLELRHLFLKIAVYYLLAVLFFVGFGSLGLSLPKNVSTHKVLAANSVRESVVITLSPSALLTRMPTVSPSPTVTPTVKPSMAMQNTASVNDFCLHVSVVYYHHVQPLTIASKLGHAQLTVDSTIFDQQISYLISAGYHTLSADDLVHALLTHQQLSGKNIVLTFDDGYDDIYSFAYPILKKYNAVGNLMIPTGLIDNPGYLTWGQLREMAGNSLIHLYSHTWSHASLGGASRTKIESEITVPQSQLQTNLGIGSTIFTYPYGSYSPLAIQILREHNYIAAFTTNPASWECESQIMTLPRIRIGNAPMSAYGF